MVLFAYYVGTLQCDVYAAKFIDSSNQVNVCNFFCLSVDRWKRKSLTDLASFHKSQKELHLLTQMGGYGKTMVFFYLLFPKYSDNHYNKKEPQT